MRMVKSRVKHPSIIMRLPHAKLGLANVWAFDGDAIIVPAIRKCGILRVKWDVAMRYLRKHCL